MERLCFTFELYPGKEAEYKQRHDQIWPEVVTAMRDAGIKNYSLFRRGTQIIAYGECYPDAATAFGTFGATEVYARWSAEFKAVIATFADDRGNIFRADEVWHLD